MDVRIVKTELVEQQLVKVEQSDPEVGTVVLQNGSEYCEEVEHEIISSNAIPEDILQSYGNADSDGNVQIVQLDDGQYTYIIENPDVIEEGTEFELEDGDHYIIEEYQGEYEEGNHPEYETVYIQPVESPQPQVVETTEVYTISEVVENQYAEEDDQPDDDDDQPDDDDDQQMAIVEEVESVPEEYIREEEEKPSPAMIQTEKMQVKIKQTLKSAASRKSKTPTKSAAVQRGVQEVIKQRIKQELELAEQDDQHEEDTQQDMINDDEDRTGGTDQIPVELKEEDRKPDIELIYECSICNKSFKTPSGVKRHISMTHAQPEKLGNKDELSFSLCPCCGEPSDSAHTTGDFDCTQCDKLFIYLNSLDRHRSIEHPKGDRYECCDCKNIFASKEVLIDHYRVHSLKSVKCHDCGREFSRKYHLDRHILQTGCMGVPKQVYECRVCTKSFTRKDNLGEHLKVHAGIGNKRKKQYTCEFCLKEFSGIALLQIHVRTHTGERPYGCDLCEKKFPSSGAMKKHRRKHTGEKPYTCPQCGVKFAAKETLNRHWRTHTGEKPHQCKFCGKAFIQAAQLRAHIFHHTGENAFTCPHCGRAFNRKLRLTTHIRFMHEGADPLSCPHPGCRKTFFRKEDVHRHMFSHTDEKPFKCDVCDKVFSVMSSLRIHQNIHKKEQPVSCEVCSRAFIRKDCLMRHMRARHRDVLEDIVTNAEKKRLQRQLFEAVTSAASKELLKNTIVWNELTLTESIKELLGLLVDEECLIEFGHPDAPVDRVLEAVIRRCGHVPALETDFDYIDKMRENAKLLFTVVIDDKAVKELLNNQTVDEVIMHVLKLARKQAKGTLEEDDYSMDTKPDISLDGSTVDEEISEDVTSLEHPATNEEEEEYEEDEDESETIDNPDPVSLDDGEEMLMEPEENENSVEYVVEEADEEAEDENDLEEDSMEIVDS